jgi:hypothetical protein
MSSKAVLMASFNRVSFLNRYSVTPSHIRNSYHGQLASTGPASCLQHLLTGVEQIMWSYGTIPNFHQVSTIAKRLR